MGRMGIRAGKLTSPEFFDKEVLVLLVRNMCESFDKNWKTKCAHLVLYTVERLYPLKISRK